MQWSDYFYYDETSPTFVRWKVDRFRGRQLAQRIKKAGDVAGSMRSDSLGNPSYVSNEVNGRKVQTHRLIWELFHDPVPKGYVIDHLNRNPWDNSIENLRCITQKENSRNQSKNSKNTSGETGIRFHCYDGNEGYFVAYWTDLVGNQRNKYFPCKIHGKEQAERLAADHRQQAIDSLNSQGAGYTKTHGK